MYFLPSKNFRFIIIKFCLKAIVLLLLFGTVIGLLNLLFFPQTSFDYNFVSSNPFNSRIRLEFNIINR